MHSKVIERYFFYGLLLVTFIFSFFILQPFWTVLVLGISFSVVLHPLHQWLTDRKVPASLSSLLLVLLFTLILCGPLLGIGVMIFNQSKDVYQSVAENGSAMPVLDSINDGINGLLPAGVNFDIHDKATDFVSYVSGNVAKIFSTTVSAFFSFILMLFIIFYFLRDGSEWKKAIIILSPLGDTEDKKIIDRLEVAINSVILGNLLISCLQGLLMGFGLWLFGIPNPAVWGLVAAITSLIPTIGTALVSVPSVLFLFFTGATSSAIGLVVWSSVMVGMVDNFLSPMIISKTTNISPLLILFAVLGGISLLGPIGVLIGPLTISLLYTLISIYRNEFKQNAQSTPV
jgi:predicted PurR-regulated permease PerM